MRVALVQMTSSDCPDDNIACLRRMLADVTAHLILTPEVTNCVSASRARQNQVLRHEAEDPSLSALVDLARAKNTHILAGSLALKTEDPDGRFANRSFMIGPGGILARYDKVHMFDVQVSATETYRESAGYRPGQSLVLAPAPAPIGMTICYDLRFPAMFRALAQAGAGIITVPSAFSQVTGAAHWQVLLQARAIETGCYILAPAQTGTHSAIQGKPRKTYGHSMIVSPWGDVLADGGTAPGVIQYDLDLTKIDQARSKIPALTHGRAFTGP